MIDFQKIEGFEWDEGNARKNEKHGVIQIEAEEALISKSLLITSDKKHSDEEERFRAYGQTKLGRLLTIIFTLRSEGRFIRVISARDMHVKERRIYEQKT